MRRRRASLIGPALVCYTAFDSQGQTLAMRITSEEVRHIALLARVGMTEEEIERMRDQLSHILENFDVLRQVDTEGVEPTGHSVEMDSVMREDEPRPSMPLQDVLANAPDREDNFVKVRAVLEE